MTTTDLFRVIIKIFGIYCFTTLMYRLQPRMTVNFGFVFFDFIINVIYMVVMGLIVFLFLFKTDRLIKLFRLNKGFDSQIINIKNLNEVGLFKFGIIIIGLLMIVDNIAPFLNFCYLEFKKQVSTNGTDESSAINLGLFIDYNWWFTYGLNIFIGIIFLTANNRISKLLMKKEKNVG
ncbi:hypothetical protein [uncultured Maribacter sp.]|uniref:hypothetical protein n=1 Tax=uncultured Maribacter sp. TaxID=431308 RepID=UPI002607BBCE|nr:hypothetical protein [uncultured Maribacter sp.]